MNKQQKKKILAAFFVMATLVCVEVKGPTKSKTQYCHFFIYFK